VVVVGNIVCLLCLLLLPAYCSGRSRTLCMVCVSVCPQTITFEVNDLCGTLVHLDPGEVISEGQGDT